MADQQSWLKLTKGLRPIGPGDDVSKLVLLTVRHADGSQSRMVCAACCGEAWASSDDSYTCWNCGEVTVTGDGDGWRTVAAPPDFPIETAPRGRDIQVFNTMVGWYRSRWADGEWPMQNWSGQPGTWYPRPIRWKELANG